MQKLIVGLIVLLQNLVYGADQCYSDTGNNTCLLLTQYDYCVLEFNFDTENGTFDLFDRRCQYVPELDIHGICTIENKTEFYDNGTFIRYCCRSSNGRCNKCPSDEVYSHLSMKNYLLLEELLGCTDNSTKVIPNSTSYSDVTTAISETASHLYSSPHEETTKNNSNSANNHFQYIIVITAGIAILPLIVTVMLLVTIGFVRYKCVRPKSVVSNEGYDKPQTEYVHYPKDELTCSSSAVTENRLLHERTLSDDIQLTVLVGKGRFGSVYLGKWGDKHFAVKEFETRSEEFWKREVDIYKTYMLSHDNILKFICSEKKSHPNSLSLWTILEYHPNGNLQEYLESNTLLKISVAFSLSVSLMEGLQYLHSSITTGNDLKPGIAHRDIKSTNILVKSNNQCCIADLGLAVRQDNTGVDHIPTNKLSSTRRYLPPEILGQSMDFDKFESYKCADVYSVSLVIWEIFNCGTSNVYSEPYSQYVDSDPSVEQMYEVVVIRHLRPPIHPEWSKNDHLSILVRLLQESWIDIPKSRPTSLSIKKKLSSVTVKEAVN